MVINCTCETQRISTTKVTRIEMENSTNKGANPITFAMTTQFDESRVFNHAVLFSSTTDPELTKGRESFSSVCIKYTTGKNELLDENHILSSRVIAVPEGNSDSDIIIVVVHNTTTPVKRMHMTKKLKEIINDEYCPSNPVISVSYDHTDDYSHTTVEKILMMVFGDLLVTEQKKNCMKELMAEKSTSLTAKENIIRKLLLDPEYASDLLKIPPITNESRNIDIPKMKERLCLLLSITSVILPWTPIRTQINLRSNIYGGPENAIIYMLAKTLEKLENYIF